MGSAEGRVPGRLDAGVWEGAAVGAPTALVGRGSMGAGFFLVSKQFNKYS